MPLIRLTSLLALLLMGPMLSSAAPLGQVILLSGAARLHPSQVLLEADRKSAPFPGGAIQTAPDSGISLRLEGRSQGGELGPSAYLALTPDNTTTRFHLHQGRASFRSSDPSHSLTIDVPQGSLRLQRATVRVLADYPQTLIWVRQGAAQVQSAGADQPPITLSAGQFTLLLHRRQPTRPRPATPEQQKSFLAWDAFPEDEPLTLLGLHAPLPLQTAPLSLNQEAQRRDQQLFELLKRQDLFEFGEQHGR